jgi:hypothetical protein
VQGNISARRDFRVQKRQINLLNTSVQESIQENGTFIIELKLFNTMKIITINQRIYVDETTAEIYDKILKTMNIRCKISSLPERKQHLTMRHFKDDYSTRTSNILLEYKLMDMTIEEFVGTYSPKDIMRFRNAGKKTVEELMLKFFSIGYNWK